MTLNKKDINIEWIGEIPSNWEYCRFKDVVNLYVGNSIKDEDKDNYWDNNDARPYISSKDINLTFNTINYDTGLYIKKEDMDFRIAPKSSILMCTEGGSAGRKKAITLKEVAYVNKLCCFVPKNNNLYYEYLFYFLCSPNYEDYFFSQMTGMIGGVSISKLNNFAILLPPLNEQKRISKFLNEQVANINNVIAELQILIEKYNEYKQSLIAEVITTGLNKNVTMIDSNVGWASRIPEHWKIIRGKYVLTQIKRSPKPNDEIITCFRDGEVTLRSKRRESGFTMSDKEIGYQGIEKGDLVVHGMDGFAGSIGISDSQGKASPVLLVLETENNKKFFMYYLRYLAYNDVFLALSSSIRERSCDLNWNKLGNLLYLIPPLDEQNEIANYLEKKCNLIDYLISEKEKLIENLEEYKKSLIFEYVTGKKEVPNDF